MRIKLSNDIQIYDPPITLVKSIVEHLTIPNPLYNRLKRMGNHRALFAVKRDFTYYTYDEEAKLLTIPRGVEHKLDTTGAVSNRAFPMLSSPVTCKTLFRDYQYDSIEVINPRENPQGIIKLSTGWGKSFLAIKLIEELQTKTLIVVPRTALLEQFVKDIRLHLGVDPGVISGKRFEVKDITVATIQSLRSKQDKMADYFDSFGMVIVDEAHTSIPPKSIGAVNSFRARHWYGLSATPDREDGQGPAIGFFYGPTLIDRELPQADPTVKILVNKEFIRVHDNYARIIDDQVTNTNRNMEIAKAAIVAARSGRKVLVLSKRIAHYQALRDAIIQADPTVKTCCIESKSKDVAETIQRCRDTPSSFDIVLGTFSLLSTGVDIPALDTLIIAGDLKSSILTKQSVGRVLRLYDMKEDPLIIDVVDQLNPILLRQGQARKRFYKKAGWPIEPYI